MNLAIRTDFPKKTESGYCTVYRHGNGWNELVIAHESRVHAGKLRIQTLDDTTNIRALDLDFRNSVGEVAQLRWDMDVSHAIRATFPLSP